MNRPRIGVALGSGAARGMAHFGVLRAIEEAGLTVDLVAGTSIGALVGAAFAANALDKLERAYRTLDWKHVLSLLDPVFPRSGLIDGQKVADFVRAHVPTATFEELALPCRAVAADLATGEEVIIAEGDLVEGVRASVSVPGIFTPVRRNGRVLIDGGIVNPVPVNVAREMGADIVIAVELNHDIVSTRLKPRIVQPKRGRGARTVAKLAETFGGKETPVLTQLYSWMSREPLPNIFDVLLASGYIMQSQIAQIGLEHHKPDLLIRPPLGEYRFMDFDRADEIIEVGYRAAVEKLPELRHKLVAGSS